MTYTDQVSNLSLIIRFVDHCTTNTGNQTVIKFPFYLQLTYISKKYISITEGNISLKNCNNTASKIFAAYNYAIYHKKYMVSFSVLLDTNYSRGKPC